MDLGKKGSDWQVCGTLQVGAGAGVGAGFFVFDFYSATAGGSARFVFKGVGIGIGGDASGSALPEEIGPFGPWSSIDVDEPFNVWDLNGSGGRLTTLGIGLGVTFGVVYITAARRWALLKSWFHSQNVGGFGIGGGAGALALLGSWGFKRTVGNTPASTCSSAAMA